jgi:hypothetical protein
VNAADVKALRDMAEELADDVRALLTLGHPRRGFWWRWNWSSGNRRLVLDFRRICANILAFNQSTGRHILGRYHTHQAESTL